MTRLSIRIDFEGSEAFGPGKARLLELIEEQGSIRGAAAAMNMSYRHAWLLLQAVEDTFGAPVISTATWLAPCARAASQTSSPTEAT